MSPALHIQLAQPRQAASLPTVLLRVLHRPELRDPGATRLDQANDASIPCRRHGRGRAAGQTARAGP